MMFGFGEQRRQLLQSELLRMAGELSALGAGGTLLVRDISFPDSVRPDTEIEMVVVLDTEEPFHRRADFLTTHLRPGVGTRFFVYTPAEYESLQGSDPVIRYALRHGQVVDEPV